MRVLEYLVGKKKKSTSSPPEMAQLSNSKNYLLVLSNSKSD